MTVKIFHLFVYTRLPNMIDYNLFGFKDFAELELFCTAKNITYYLASTIFAKCYLAMAISNRKLLPVGAIILLVVSDFTWLAMNIAVFDVLVFLFGCFTLYIMLPMIVISSFVSGIIQIMMFGWGLIRLNNERIYLTYQQVSAEILTLF